MANNGCPFCDYDGEVVAEFSAGAIIRPLQPVTDGHLLAISWPHVTDALEDPETAGYVMEAAATYARTRSIGPCNLITSVGTSATQTVFHLHVHIVPRSPDDGLRLPWSP